MTRSPRVHIRGQARDWRRIPQGPQPLSRVPRTIVGVSRTPRGQGAPGDNPVRRRLQHASVLMLSGVGPAEVLRANGIEPVPILEGVGQNLQDRYEISAIHRTTKSWSCLAGVEFSTDDQMFAEWRRGRGMYCSNGAAVAFIARSSSAREAPDLFGMALLTRFRGYFPGYSKDIRASRSDLSFALLKAHTLNHGGLVTLRSPDPRDPPLIDFRGFEEGTDTDGKDLAAVIEGVAHLRNMMKAGIGGELKSEDTPGPAVTGASPSRSSSATTPGAITPLVLARSVPAPTPFSRVTSASVELKACGSSTRASSPAFPAFSSFVRFTWSRKRPPRSSSMRRRQELEVICHDRSGVMSQNGAARAVPERKNCGSRILPSRGTEDARATKPRDQFAATRRAHK